MVAELEYAIERYADKDGNAPVLDRMEFCQDGIDKMYHFCTPDGTRFATDKVQRKCGRITIVERPDHAGIHGSRDIMTKPAVVDNFWTITAGYWVEEKPSR